MAEDNKKQPSLEVPQRSLIEAVELALKDEERRRRFVVKLTVRGGLKDKKYSFDFTASGDGAAHCRLECSMTGRKGESGKATLTDTEFTGLLRKVEPAVRLPQDQRRFLPDTLLGILEISDGTETRRIYFAADPEQAKTQDRVPPPEVMAAVNAIYAIGARLTGSRTVKP
jgi:hypothetical protein